MGDSATTTVGAGVVSAVGADVGADVWSAEGGARVGSNVGAGVGFVATTNGSNNEGAVLDSLTGGALVAGAGGGDGDVVTGSEAGGGVTDAPPLEAFGSTKSETVAAASSSTTNLGIRLSIAMHLRNFTAKLSNAAFFNDGPVPLALRHAFAAS